MTHRSYFLVQLGIAALLVAALCPIALCRSARLLVNREQHVQVTGAANPNKIKALKPNLDLYVYRRCFSPGEAVQVNLSTFNAPVVQFAAYPLDLGAAVTSSTAMKDFGKTLKILPLGRRATASWRVAVKSFPDQWAGASVKVPKLMPGAYILVATASSHGVTVQKRTWIAITQVALLAKRSPEEMLVYACDVNSGRPMPNVSLRLADENGRLGQALVTGAAGTARSSAARSASGSLWIFGSTKLGPAFAIAAAPDVPEPYAVYTVTDRPIYRPGNLVQYKATIRKRIDDTAAPGGFRWQSYAAQPATIELRDATDALVEQKTLTTDANGTISSTLQLAPEPTLGEWHLIVVLSKTHRVYSQFAVLAYRKPEMTVSVTFDQAHYLGGATVPATINAQYIFGRPVVGARVRYTVAFDGAYASAAQRGGTTYDAVGITDARGQLHLDIPTYRTTDGGNLFVQATVTDLSRRSAQARGNTFLTPGLFGLALHTDKPVYRTGERIVLSAQAMDYDEKPVPGVKVALQMVETKEDDQHRAYDETTTRSAVTDKNGNASAYFSTPREAEVEFQAEAFDAQSDKITADSGAQVTADKGELAAAQPEPTLDLHADKQQYKPGGLAIVTIHSLLAHRPAQAAQPGLPARPARKEAWALVTLEGERLGIARVIHLSGASTRVTVPLGIGDFPSITLNVSVIEDRQLYEQQITLPVTVPGKSVTVSLSPDKAKYQPGDTAVYTISTRNGAGAGAGVPADVSLGVVDSSIYQLAPDNAEDMASVFYAGQSVRVTSSYSFAAQYSGGGYQVIAEKAESPTTAPDGIRVRSQFADTAYWNPNVETGANGMAQVRFTVPDNLTTWRATARAITADTATGSGTSDVVSAMPLLVRMELPRFAVAGDHLTVSAIVQNGTPVARSVHVTLQARGASPDAADAIDQIVAMPPDGQQRFDWPVTILSQDGSARPSPARFTVVADGGPGGRDAAEGALPVLPDGVQSVSAVATTLSGAEASRTIDLTQLPPGASVQLTLSSSLASGVAAAASDLAARPDAGADAEETADTLLADVAAARVLRDSGSGAAVASGADVNTFVSVALQKLYRYQHPDGGWNWWEFDQTDGDMTATILSALAQTRASGFAVDEARLSRGADALGMLLQRDQDLDSRADWLLALSSVQPDAARAPLLALTAQRDKLTTYSRASLALGLAQVAGSDANSKAGQAALAVAQQLASSATVQGRTAFWPLQPSDAGSLWSGDDVTLTAHVLRALLSADPGDERIEGAARWLMANRDGASWDSTRATAEAVLALAQYTEQTHELSANYTARVLLDGQSVGALNAANQPAGSSLVVSLTPEQMQGRKSVVIEKLGGSGQLYISQVTTSLVPAHLAVPQMHGITVKRYFRFDIHDPSHASSVASGTEIDVVLEISADNDYRYVKVEDRLPAGCEVVSDADNGEGGGSGGYPIDSSDGDVGYTRQETRDDRVEFTFDSLPKGTTRLIYHLSAETPGTYRILAAAAALTYQPEVRGSTDLAQITIGD